MSFCTAAQVLSIVDSDMSSAEVTELIARTDARIKLKIDTTSTPSNLTAAEWADFLEDLSATWTGLRVMLKDPTSEGLGEWRGDRSDTIKMLREEISDMLKAGGGGIAMAYHSESLPRW